jgi:hypothetical protein
MSSLHEALQPLMIAFLSREVYSERLRRSKEIGVVGYPAMKPDKKAKREERGAYAFVPAHAAQVGIGCSGENLARTEGAVEAMTDGPGKFVAQREVAQAQDAMLNGMMSGCAMHLGRAMHAGSLTQAPYANTMAQAPAETAPTSPVPTAMAMETDASRAVSLGRRA